MSKFYVSLAQISIEIEAMFDSTKEFCKEYRTEKAPIFSVAITQDDIEKMRLQEGETDIAEECIPVGHSDNYMETLALANVVLEKLLNYGVLMFHGAVMAVNGKAYLFMAKSGTGKTTHCRLWLKNIPGCHILNGDKPLLLFKDKKVYVCGSPWTGKEGYGVNEILQLEAICLLERDEENHIEEIQLRNSLSVIMNQCHIPDGRENVFTALNLIKQLSSVKLYRLGCNMKDEAALVSYHGMVSRERMRAIYKDTVSNSMKTRGYLREYGLDAAFAKYNKIGDRVLLQPQDFQNIIFDRISAGEPFFAGRFGYDELNAVGISALGINDNESYVLNALCHNAGFFPANREKMNCFAQLMIHSMSLVDVQGAWWIPFEDYALKHWIPQNAVISEIRYLEPWFAEQPWTRALIGKKVLVVSMFQETIESQYKNRDKLFKNPDFLPEFQLITIKAVQTFAGIKDPRFDSWFEALDYMRNQALALDFDIALIGCGAYGYPLAASLKEAGKQAIHMGV